MSAKLRDMGMTYQALHKVVAFAHEHTPSNRQVSVKPGVPEASPIWLHIHAHKTRLEAVGDRLQLQAWAAAAAAAEQSGIPIHNSTDVAFQMALFMLQDTSLMQRHRWRNHSSSALA